MNLTLITVCGTAVGWHVPPVAFQGEEEHVATEPPTMRAIIQHGYGAPRDVLRAGQIQRPPADARDVLIRVRATSVNTPDWAMVAGVPALLRLVTGLRRPSHPVRGSDVAGVVEAVGSQVTDLRPGNEVFGSLWGSTAKARPGTFAEYAVVPGHQVVRKPAAISFEEAAASVMTGLTALIAMRDVGQVGAGSRVLVNGPWPFRSPRRWAPRSPGYAARATSSWSALSERPASSTTRRRTSPAAGRSTTSS
jgi:hypothetical protein